VADNRQFGSPKTPRFGDKPAPGDTGHCGQCEAMLADALDGMLSPADQALFNLHTAHCGPCVQLLADARRGAAWLEVLRNPVPEPPAGLLEKILAETSDGYARAQIGLQVGLYDSRLPGAALASASIIAAGPPVLAPGYVAFVPASFAKVIPFHVRARSFAQTLLQPRFAMTAAMAFLSIALTLSLTGVHLQDLRASDLRPTSIKRGFYSTNARVVQYYEGLRVVYELESRMHDLQSAADDDPSAASQAAPATNSVTPSVQPSPSEVPPVQPAPRQRPVTPRPAPPSGTSRREEMQRSTRRLA
jgi:hypothetical protein